MICEPKHQFIDVVRGVWFALVDVARDWWPRSMRSITQVDVFGACPSCGRANMVDRAVFAEVVAERDAAIARAERAEAALETAMAFVRPLDDDAPEWPSS